MKKINGDMFDLFFSKQYDGLCITTNGERKRNGTAVMGAGIALEATKKINGIEMILGKKLRDKGNITHALVKYNHGYVFSVPTKNKWRDASDLELINQSCKRLVKFVDYYDLKNVLVPPLGCGFGGLKLNDVLPIMEQHFDDRFVLVNNRG